MNEETLTHDQTPIALPVEAGSDAPLAPLNEETNEALPIAEESENWQARCLAAEAALSDLTEFSRLSLAEGGEIPAADSEVFRRFSELRALGLSVKEAFYAVDAEREKPLSKSMAGKEHLLFAHQNRYAETSLHAHEAIRLAKDLLGEELSSDELLKLYRRVAK